MKKRCLIKVTDNDGLIQEGRKLFKIHHYGRRHNLVYQEINPEEYDRRIQELTKCIASHPDVNLTDVLKDALYDLPLKRLDKLEVEVKREIEKASVENRPVKIKTATTQRGTCVDLAVGGRFTIVLRD